MAIFSFNRRFTLKQDKDQAMIIILNGENKQLDSGTHVEKLLQILDLSDKRLAVEINEQIIPRSDFSSYALQESDKVEIVQAIGGGSC